ncbi:hypothetical protein P168DRAFT_30397 [Aspergillus campestris IBT 28561]|uniref:Uncharacterized protein n=1 Tax=Aspergillus campestris (strain IBT 28561) TaxID=1392248 RepID=A0A2I1DGS1_ASPC2|nr:uncharacterized protein P168DRAFT_30397 [Aspergillus campestris IBT 28561]PKY09069.1 hypothetical protein P168DRAFT_30397 [Aspergillus campestris IBT 28561]
MEHLRKSASSMVSFGQNVIREHPKSLAVGSTGLALAAAPITGPVILGAVGFSATGPVAASLAAAWQSSLGAVQAGSLFATLQGAAMGGAASGAFTTVSNIGLAIVGSAAMGTQLTDKKKRIPGEHDNEYSSEAKDHEESPRQISDTDDSLNTEFARMLRIDMS